MGGGRPYLLPPVPPVPPPRTSRVPYLFMFSAMSEDRGGAGGGGGGGGVSSSSRYLFKCPMCRCDINSVTGLLHDNNDTDCGSNGNSAGDGVSGSQRRGNTVLNSNSHSAIHTHTPAINSRSNDNTNNDSNNENDDNHANSSVDQSNRTNTFTGTGLEDDIRPNPTVTRSRVRNRRSNVGWFNGLFRGGTSEPSRPIIPRTPFPSSLFSPGSIFSSSFGSFASSSSSSSSSPTSTSSSSSLHPTDTPHLPPLSDTALYTTFISTSDIAAMNEEVQVRLSSPSHAHIHSTNRSAI